MMPEDVLERNDHPLLAIEEAYVEGTQFVHGEVLPKALVKACVDDHYSYIALLRTGLRVRLEGAELMHPGWVRLNGAIVDDDWHGRGLEVRIADIVAIEDAC